MAGGSTQKVLIKTFLPQKVPSSDTAAASSFFLFCALFFCLVRAVVGWVPSVKRMFGHIMCINVRQCQLCQGGLKLHDQPIRLYRIFFQLLVTKSLQKKQRRRVILCTGWGKIKYPNTKVAISQKCLNTFAPNFAYLFVTILCTNVLLCAVFTGHNVKLTETQTSRTNFTTEKKVIKFVVTSLFLCLRATYSIVIDPKF